MTAWDGASGALQIALYTKTGCHLCDDLLIQLHNLQSEIDFQLMEHNIERNPDDFNRFQYLIPVLDIPGSGFLYPPHDLNVIRQAILSAMRTASSQS